MPSVPLDRRYMTALQRLLAQTDRRGDEECWPWIGTITSKNGDKYHLQYGRFWLNGTNEAAHRAAWKLLIGEIPQGMILCHSCDVPWCVNPNHLFLGTHKDNTQDMMAKGRDAKCRETRRGVNSNFAKLTPEQVRAIRKDERLQREIAADYGIDQVAVSKIKRRENWKHLED